MKSQADRMLEALRDGEWHNIGELHNNWGIGRPNSRANDLRGRSLVIEYRRLAGESNANLAHQYRLLEESAETAPPQARPLADSSSGPASIPSGRSEPSALTSGVLLPRDRGVASEGPLELVQPSLFTVPRGAYDEAAA